MAGEEVLQEEEEEEEAQAPLYGDILQTILSHVPLIDLVPASHVSKTWRSAVFSSLSKSLRVKPWLMVNIQNRRNPSLITTHAYDLYSHVWIKITQSHDPFTSFLRSSHSNLLYMLSQSKFKFSFDPLNATWHDVDVPLVWRSDPIVAIVGPYLVIAGGTCEFEDDPLAVEMYDVGSRRWHTCQSMPAILKDSAATTWLSVAVSDEKMYVLEKNSGVICLFDPEKKKWEGEFHLHLNPPVFFSVIGFSGDRLILVGLVGENDNIENLGLWEVNCDTFECKEIGKMPREMLEILRNSKFPITSIGVSTAGDFVYIYNPSNPSEIFFCEFIDGICNWGKIQNSVVNDCNMMDRFLITCSEVGIGDLQKSFRSGKVKFAVKEVIGF